MMAAISAAENGNDVHLYEKNEKLGKKIYITGKGRCNVTNGCDIEELFEHIVTNKKFMYSSIYTFDNIRVQEFFENAGCPLKTERGNRVFPVSDKSYDVINALERSMKKYKVDINLFSDVTDLIIEDNVVKGIVVDGKKIYGDKVIVAKIGRAHV